MVLGYAKQISKFYFSGHIHNAYPFLGPKKKYYLFSISYMIDTSTWVRTGEGALKLSQDFIQHMWPHLLDSPQQLLMLVNSCKTVWQMLKRWPVNWMWKGSFGENTFENVICHLNSPGVFWQSGELLAWKCSGPAPKKGSSTSLLCFATTKIAVVWIILFSAFSSLFNSAQWA